LKLNRFIRVAGFVLFLFSFFVGAQAQSPKKDDDSKVIQLSGVVTEMDSSSVLPGVHIYIPKTGRGTISNYYGYFSFPVLEGDSIVFTSVGFERFTFVVPKVGKEDKYTFLVAMREDTTYLPEVEILPYPTEELFKEAVLAMRIPNQEELNNMANNLDPALLQEMYTNMPMDGSMNHRYFSQQYAIHLHDQYGPRPNPLLNPFAWADFIKSLKKKK